MSIDALVFDAYGTLFDVHSVVRRCDAFWPGKGAALSVSGYHALTQPKSYHLRETP